MEKSQLIGSILNYLSADVVTVEFTRCTRQWREYNYVPSYSKIYYILEGEGRLVIDGKEYFPKPGQMCIMPANVRQSYEAISDDAYLKYWTHFTCSSGGISIFDIIRVPYVIDIAQEAVQGRLEMIFSSMIGHYRHRTFVFNLMLESYIRELLAIYLEQAGIENVEISSTKDSDRQSMILKYIEDNLDKKISVEDVAREVYLHPNYFIKYFKKSFGISPARYINKRKIELACEMLGKGEQNISETALMLGYNDIYHFSKVFKKHTGFSPSYYRNFISPVRNV
jgi:AraC family transcriptional regulator of arabinose operon